MDPETLAELRQKLAARRDELLGEGDIDIEPALKAPGEKVDEDAAPLTEMSQVIASRRNRTRALELERIQVALQRIDNEPDDFGFCDSCDEPIPPKRLEIKPWARFCVKCGDARTPKRGARRRHTRDYVD